MADVWRTFAGKQRERAVASILGHCERSPWWRELTPDQRRALRDKVLASVGVYHDVVLDLLRSIDDQSLGNPEVVRILDLVHASQRQLLGRDLARGEPGSGSTVD